MTQPEQDFLDALGALRRALDEIEKPSMIMGGVAVIALGVPPLTVDIDATITAADLNLEQLVEALARHGIQPRIPDAAAFARSQQVFLGVHEASGTPVDLSLAWLPFEEEALRASQACNYAGVETRTTMDLGRVRQTVSQFAEVLNDAERPQVLERLIRKTGFED